VEEELVGGKRRERMEEPAEMSVEKRWKGKGREWPKDGLTMDTKITGVKVALGKLCAAMDGAVELSLIQEAHMKVMRGTFLEVERFVDMM
jgi:hypothetical protein